MTGSGKSVCINSIIASLIKRVDMYDFDMLLVDPKGVELGMYANLPNCVNNKVLVSSEESMAGLRWLVDEMERRYALLAKYNARNIKSYNEKIKEVPLTKGCDLKMKYIVCVVDEFADLMMTSGAELTQLVQRLAQKSRAVGIHLILATQRPSVKVITGDLKANLPYRIAFKVSSAVDSVTILGKGGAERLLGNGDMILSANDELERVHGVYFSDSTIDKIINHIDMNTFVLFDRRVDFATGQCIFDAKNPIDVDLVAEIDEGVRPIADAELKRIKELRNISRCHRLDVTLWLLYHAGDRLSDSAVERFISNRNLFGYYFKWKSLRKVA
jgi:S-DNA-T family DNA segregation ATPase FtsK/SpoIIIE